MVRLTRMEATMLLTTSQLSRRWNVHRVTVWRWLERPDFPRPVRLGSSSPRWPLPAIEAWELAQTEPTSVSAET
jgi:predicted DNA-binding transcriptional regulator AlpA